GGGRRRSAGVAAARALRIGRRFGNRRGSSDRPLAPALDRRWIAARSCPDADRSVARARLALAMESRAASRGHRETLRRPRLAGKARCRRGRPAIRIYREGSGGAAAAPPPPVPGGRRGSFPRQRRPPPARVFMVADAHYFRARGAYHLYPYNVFFDPWNNTVPPPTSMRPGDYIVVYQRRGIQFDAAQGMLRWDNGQPLRAEALVVEPGAALFRVR